MRIPVCFRLPQQRSSRWRRPLLLLAVGCAAVIAAVSSCSARRSGTGQKTAGLVVASPHPLMLLTPIIQNFENETGITVQVVQGGTGILLENIRRYPDVAEYDILWGGSYSSILPAASLFESYVSINDGFMQPVYKNTEGTMNRFSDIPSVIMVNKNLLGAVQVTGYGSLLDPRLKGLIAFSDPEASSSSWEHIINMLYDAGHGDPDHGWWYVDALCNNLDGVLLDSSQAVYAGVADGKFAVGLTFEEGGANYAENDPNIGLVYMDEGVVFTPDGVYMPKNAPHRDTAKKFIDYVTGYDVQNYISQVMNRRSVLHDVEPKSFLPSKDSLPCVAVDYEAVAANKQKWIAHFHDLFENSVKDIPYDGR